MQQFISSLLVLLATGISLAIGNRINFYNYGVYRISPGTWDEIEILKELDGSTDSLTFLDAAEIPNRDIHVVVAPHKQPDFVEMLNETGINFDLIETNLQRHLNIDDAEKEKDNPLRKTKSYNWKSYHTLDETYNWLETTSKKYPNHVSLLVGGKTYEGRDIRGVKISYKPGNKGIFIEGGIHAREWISPATVTYILNELLTSSDTNVRHIAENYDWYIFPHANPDGYVYTHTTNRLWRKTRSRNRLCFGVDPNRNWGYHWNEAGTSRNPCADTYAGRSAFSEIEVRSLSNFIKSLKNLRTYLSFHSYSQLLLFPYGHTRQHSAHYKQLKQVGDAAIKALARRYGTRYVAGTTYEVIYPASGSSVDWAYGSLHIPLAYTYELRPKDSWNGFVLPPEQIIKTGEETLDSLVALVKEAEKIGTFK